MNVCAEEIIDVSIRGEIYPVTKSGAGVACLAIGIGTLT